MVREQQEEMREERKRKKEAGLKKLILKKIKESSSAGTLEEGQVVQIVKFIQRTESELDYEKLKKMVELVEKEYWQQ